MPKKENPGIWNDRAGRWGRASLSEDAEAVWNGRIHTDHDANRSRNDKTRPSALQPGPLW